MISSVVYALGVLASANALPGFSKVASSNAAYVLPQLDPNLLSRQQEVVAGRAGYRYGPSLLGNSSFFPTGPLGDQRVAADVALFTKNATYITLSIEKETPPVEEAVRAVCTVLPQLSAILADLGSGRRLQGPLKL